MIANSIQSHWKVVIQFGFRARNLNSLNQLIDSRVDQRKSKNPFHSESIFVHHPSHYRNI